MPASLWTPQKPIGRQVHDQLALIQDVKAVYNVDLGLTDITLALKEYIALKEKGRKGREPVAIGFPFVGMLTAAFFIGFCRMRQSPQDYMIPVIDTTLLSAARNKCVETFLASNYNWLLFLDSDVTPPTDGIDRLMAHGKKIVSGLYHQKGGEFLPNMYTYKGWNEETGQHDYNWITEWKQGETIAVDAVGAGFLLIHREVLEAIGTTDWFNFKEGGEDLAFCRQAKAKGYDIWVDTSIKCGHVSYMVVNTDHFYARRLGLQRKEEITEAIDKVAKGLIKETPCDT